MSAAVIEAAARLLREGRRGAIVTLVETVGSTPRRAGAKMLVADDGAITGTVGGGCVEADLHALAMRAMRTGAVSLHEVDLTARAADDNDMMCGGRLKALIEPVAGDDRLIVLGAGHISRALAAIAARTGFAVTVTDDRAAFASPDRFPEGTRLLAMPFEEQFAALAVTSGDSLVIATRGHSHDALCVEAALATPARYIGLVGSRTKMAVFRSRLKAAGASDAELDRVECPCGVDIRAETPEEIAVSILARLVQARRGADAADGK